MSLTEFNKKKQVQKWTVINLTSQPVALGDIPGFPSIAGNAAFDMLQYATKQQIGQSVNLDYCLRKNILKINKYFGVSDTTADVVNDTNFDTGLSTPTFDDSGSGGTTNASDITTGTLDPARLPLSGVTAGIYGNATNVSQVTLDDKGRVTLASNVLITPAFSSITGKPTTLSGYGITDAQQALFPNGVYIGLSIFTPSTAAGSVGTFYNVSPQNGDTDYIITLPDPALNEGKYIGFTLNATLLTGSVQLECAVTAGCPMLSAGGDTVVMVAYSGLWYPIFKVLNSFDDIINTPTTLSGYGITNGMTLVPSATSGNIAVFDGSGQVIDGGPPSSGATVTTRVVAGTTDTILDSDIGNYVVYTSASPVTITTNSTLTTLGKVTLVRSTAATVTTTGTRLLPTGTGLSGGLRAQNSIAELHLTASSTPLILTGDIN